MQYGRILQNLKNTGRGDGEYVTVFESTACHILVLLLQR